MAVFLLLTITTRADKKDSTTVTTGLQLWLLLRKAILPLIK